MKDMGRIFHDEAHFLALLGLSYFIIRQGKQHVNPQSTWGKALTYLFH